MALIDDSSYERNQVQSALPQVRVYDVSEMGSLLQKSEFNVLITDESKNRRLMYKAEEKRNELMQAADNGDTISFLKKCNLRIELFSPQSDEEKQRYFYRTISYNNLTNAATRVILGLGGGCCDRN